jgi:hypothetical protein
MAFRAFTSRRKCQTEVSAVTLGHRKLSFFEARTAAAQIVRDEAVRARQAVRQHPELASRGLRDPEGRRRFVAQVRSALADNIERGNRCQYSCANARSVRSWKIPSRFAEFPCVLKMTDVRRKGGRG